MQCTLPEPPESKDINGVFGALAELELTGV